MLKLKDPSLLVVDSYIDGVWTGAAERTAIRNPANGEIVAEVADLGSTK